MITKIFKQVGLFIMLAAAVVLSFGGQQAVAATVIKANLDSDLNESTTPAWAVANLKAGATFGHWRVQLVLENPFDRTYNEHFSYLRDPFRSGNILNEPGRRAALTLGWSM